MRKIYNLLLNSGFIFTYILNFLRTLYVKPISFTKVAKNDLIHILGNGPSSLETFKSLYNAKDKVAVCNFFALNDIFFEIKPRYYFLVDPMFYNLNVRKEKIEALFEVLNKKVNWDMEVITLGHLKFETKKDLNIRNNFIKVKKIKSAPLELSGKVIFKLYQLNIATPKFINVVICAMYYIMNKGYKNIYVHGIESSYFKSFIVNSFNQVIIEEEHFYGKNIRNLDTEGEVKKGELYKKLKCDVDSFYNYSLISKYAEFLRIRVTNCTKGSYVDTLPRYQWK